MLGISSILLIDAKPENQNQLKAVLASLQLDCVCAHTGGDALDLIEDQTYDLIILATAMKGIDGFETIKAIRKNQNYRYVPVLFLIDEGPEQVAMAARAFEFENADFLYRPCNEEILAGKVRLFAGSVQRLKELKSENLELNRNVDTMRDFVGIVTHDLRAPLGKLINISEVLMAGVDQEELPTFYKLLQKTCRRAFDMVNDMLDLAAVESGRFKLEITRCDIWPLAIQAISELNYLADQKDIRLVNDIADSIEVKADGRRIFQVLINLITNALKFTPRYGTINLTARVQGDEVFIEVRDTGVGIPKDTLPLLFFKHQKTTTRGTEGERGTGFGLPLCQQLIKAHGSSIVVESEEGKGSAFGFTLHCWKD